MTPSTFRHAPAKALIDAPTGATSFDWRREPAVTGLRRFRYDNIALGRSIDVPISATPAVIGDVGVVVASDDGFVRLLDHALDRTFWERRLSASIYASLVVDPIARRVIACDTAGLVCAIDLRGTVAWTRDLRQPVFATPAIDPENGLLVVCAFGDAAFGLDLASGTVRYRADLPAPWYTAVDSPVARRNPYASPAMTGTGVVICSGSHVLALTPDGAERWRTAIDADIKSSPVTVPALGRVVVADVSGRCHALRLDDGTNDFTLTLGAKLVASGAHSGGIVALGGTNGQVWGVDVGRGAVAWTSAIGAPAAYGSITTTPLGDFVATDANGNAVCLAADTGAFLWESSQVMGLADQATRMDVTPIVDRGGRMYGAGYDGSLYRFAFARGAPA